ncbi:FkbM family methyltransferase [Azorhizobium sp. AG788]|uniref:FkbM family methyltransferase n=1 Tax=Azorhizobium sp. AG788 TaxID=2183897 RepID=UPI003139531F
MTQISYAQNFEDVLLHRSLSDVACGFYIDVGANDPRFHSVTKRFYDLGWRGINIEPSSSYFEKLCQDRPRDLNIKAVVSNRDGVVRFFEFEGTGISTTEQDIAECHQVNGYLNIETEVEAVTLATICQKHVDAPVHFMKIDVEGGTRYVLEGMDLQAVRPWIIVVEATKPMTQIEDSDEWEHLILSQNYEFVYADGLNRYYLAFEHAERRERFKFPPNVFDDFVICALHDETILRQAREAAEERAVERLRVLEQESARLAAVVQAEDARGQAAEAKIVELSQEKAGLEAALAEQVSRAQGAEERIGILEQDKIALAAAVQAEDARGRAAEARIVELSREKAGLEAALVEQVARAQGAEGRVGVLEQEKAGLEAALESRSAQVQALEARVGELEGEAVAQGQALAAQAARAAAAEMHLEQEQVAHAQALSALQASREAHGQATAAAAQLAGEMAGLEAALARMEERLQAAMRRVVELEKVRHDLQVRLAEEAERTQAHGARADHLEAILRRVADSLSWRITKPLRGWGKSDGKRPSGS